MLSDGYPPWERGGAQKIASQLAEGHRERGHEVGVLTGVTDRTEAGRATANGVEVRTLWTPKPRSLFPYLTLYNPFVVRKVERAPVVKTYHDAGTVAYGDLTGFLEDREPNEPLSPADYRVSPCRQLRSEGIRYNPIRN